jgi:hypothetical protein
MKVDARVRVRVRVGSIMTPKPMLPRIPRSESKRGNNRLVPISDVSSLLAYSSHMATLPYPCYPRGGGESSVPPRNMSNQLRHVEGESGSCVSWLVGWLVGLFLISNRTVICQRQIIRRIIGLVLSCNLTLQAQMVP